MDGDALTTILSNNEDQVVQSLPTHTINTWKFSVFSLVVTERDSNYRNKRSVLVSYMLETVTWQAGNRHLE